MRMFDRQRAQMHFSFCNGYLTKQLQPPLPQRQVPQHPYHPIIAHTTGILVL